MQVFHADMLLLLIIVILFLKNFIIKNKEIFIISLMMIIIIAINYKVFIYMMQTIRTSKLWMVPGLIGCFLIFIKIIRIEEKKTRSYQKVFLKSVEKLICDYLLIPFSVYFVFYIFAIVSNKCEIYSFAFLKIYIFFLLIYVLVYRLVLKLDFKFMLFVIMLWLPLITGNINVGVFPKIILNHSTNLAYFNINLTWLSSFILIAYIPQSFKFVWEKLYVRYNLCEYNINKEEKNKYDRKKLTRATGILLMVIAIGLLALGFSIIDVITFLIVIFLSIIITIIYMNKYCLKSDYDRELSENDKQKLNKKILF
ncbi:DUF3784 domain-containing protein [Desulfosporosinus sp. FKB]|uniref:DUF3784 domain-containing protein n=1 Tax=Desulfosporosinus sp. FKB TaxID=1969835 RepID=UPI000B4A0592|nr:DUF3784 domain-containing protein [Desulfosporosinus sp. FKB]